MYFKILEKYKKIVVETGKEIVDQNLTIGTWGNISVLHRDTGLVYIKPSAMEYHKIELKDIVVIDQKGQVVEGSKKPSVETPLHLAVYKERKDVGAIVHYHSIYSSVFAVTGLTLPGICEDFVQIVGDKVLCAEYALPGTKALAKRVVDGLGKRNAVFLANHGTLCVGKDIREAIKVSSVVEKTAHIYILSKNLGKCKIISEEDIKAMQDFYRDIYRKQ